MSPSSASGGGQPPMMARWLVRAVLHVRGHPASADQVSRELLDKIGHLQPRIEQHRPDALLLTMVVVAPTGPEAASYVDRLLLGISRGSFIAFWDLWEAEPYVDLEGG